MASFNERIAVTIDVVTDKATKGLKDFKSSVKEADGVTGKLKAGTKSLGQTFKGAASNPALLAGGITAAAGVALKAVDDFANLGIEVGQFSDATGLAVEDASRWMEVAGDLGIEADGLKGTIGKLNKSIDPELFKKLGIEIATTKDGATDVNATFLNTIERLKAIKDPAERARVAAQLLGKGWQSSAELIAMSTDDIRKRLGEVSDEKVFDEKEVEQARRYRDVMDEAGDVMQDLAITIGENLLPAVVSIVELVKPAADGIGYLADKSNELKAATSDSDGNSFFGNIKENFSWFITNIKEGRSPLEAFGGATDDLAVSNSNVNKVLSDGHRIWSTHSTNVDTVTESLKADEEATKRAYEATRKLRQAIEGLNDIQLDSLAAKTDLVTQTFELATAQGDYNAKVKEGKTSTAELAVEANTLAQEAADLAKNQGEVNGHTQTATERSKLLMDEFNRMQSTLDVGSPLWNAIQAYKDQLLSIPTNIATSVSITEAGRGTANRPSFPAGGGGQTVDGERVDRAAAGQTVINMYPRQMPTERELTDLINQTRRRQGPVI